MASLPPHDYLQLKTRMESVQQSFPSCLNCEHFEEEAEHCKLYKIRPPARIIAYSCPSWDQLLPF
jgi:hypothetical protein